MDRSVSVFRWVALLAGLLASTFTAPAQGLRVSDNGRYLVTDEGKPFFYLADTGWELFHRLSRQEADYYLRNRAGKGFTVIQAVLLSEINGLTVANREGHLPLIGLDPTRPNEAYFELVDYVVDRAAEYGLTLALAATWGAHVEDKPHPLFENLHIFTPENARAYGRFLGARYRDRPHIIWVLGGDRTPVGHEPIWDAMAGGLKEGMLGRHLITYHSWGFTSSSQWFHDRTWLDFNMVQVGHRRRSNIDYALVKTDYDRLPPKPVLNAETTYEALPIAFSEANGRFDDYDVRKAAYWSVFAGAFGHTYGHNSIWQMVRPGDEPILWADMPWMSALEAPGAAQMVHLKRLMQSRPFLTRYPDDTLILPFNEEDPPAGLQTDRVVVTRDGTPGNQDATYIMAYLPHTVGLALDTSVIPGPSLRVWWFSPRDGAAYPIGRIDNTGVFEPGWDVRIRAPQVGPDWVLVIDDAAMGYAAPGTGILDR